MLVDIITFEMIEFDIILGMDFLERYKAEIDYQSKKVWFSLEHSNELDFGKGYIRNMIFNTIKARKMLGKQCTCFLAHIIDKVESDLSIDKILIIQRFLDVVPKELLRLVPEREIKFKI